MNTAIVCRLVPLEVPWMVSPSVPELSMSTRTMDGAVSGVVKFIAFFGDGTATAEKWGQYQRIEVLLEDVIYARQFPEFSPEDQERLDAFDWSAVPEFRDESGGLSGSVERSRQAWNESMICPSPSSYQVSNSDVISKLGLSETDFLHLMFLGDDFSVEAVARRWKWKIADEHAATNDVAEGER